jgi:hypothetical protein
MNMLAYEVDRVGFLALSVAGLLWKRFLHLKYALDLFGFGYKISEELKSAWAPLEERHPSNRMMEFTSDLNAGSFFVHLKSSRSFDEVHQLSASRSYTGIATSVFKQVFKAKPGHWQALQHRQNGCKSLGTGPYS